MFTGRNEELNELTRLYKTDRFQCVIIYGRRRVGKTALISEFIKDKEAIYFVGQETNAKENLEGLSEAVFSLSQDFSEASPYFKSYKDAIETVFRLAEKKRLIIAIDEYPYLAANYKGISSLLQTYIDKHKETSKLFLILCGSSLSFMENQVMGYQSPLYGRRTAQFRILPFEYKQAANYLGDRFSNTDKAVLYGITGGVPLYLSLIDNEISVADNIKLNFFKPSGFLFEEPGNLIKQECREPAQYNAIIKAIAGGASRLSEISSKVGLETSLCSTYLSRLISIGIIKKEHPFREERSKKTIYLLDDNMFRFWYRFIPENLSLIQRGEADLVYERVEPVIPTFMGIVFEDICMQYLWSLNKKRLTPIIFSDAGRWWGNNPKSRKECEIDIIADDKQNAIFCECKWTNKTVCSDVLDALIENSKIFNYKTKYYYLFTKTGFTKKVQEKAAKMGNVVLVLFNEIITAS